MCGRNQTNIDMNGLGTSQPLELLLLQGTQQFRLQIHRNVADLVQKQSAVIRQLKPASLLDQRPGESTLFVAEELAFHQTRRNCGTVQADKGALTPRAEIMKRSGHQLLAGAGLAVQ